MVDEQFCRGGEVGYFRTFLGITGKKSHKLKVDLFQRGAAGASELRMKGSIPGTDEEIRLQLVKTMATDGTVEVDYMPQLIVTTEDGEVHHILLGNMTEPEQLQNRLGELKVGGLKQVNVIAPEIDLERIEKLTSFVPALQKENWERLPDKGVTYTKTEFEVDDRYFRAVAKIAFHYILKHFRHFRGDEPMFAGIRNFIMKGGNISDFVTWKDKQIIEIQKGLTPNTWAHLIVARADENRVSCRLQFFLGPNCKPWVFTVAIARNESKLVYDITSAHSFVYYEGGPRNGKFGVMDPMLWVHKG